MKKIKQRIHLGSDFDDFLREEGILEEVEAGAIKKIIALQIEAEMKKKKKNIKKIKTNK